MRLIDKIALNRLISLILGFILTIVKLCLPENGDQNTIDKPKEKKLFPTIRRKKKQ